MIAEEQNLKSKQREADYLGSRIVHIHPTLRCNLSCRHCYSSSLPSYRKELNLSHLKYFLEYAYQHGYDTVSISGGEPFLYKDLDKLLIFTKAFGYKNIMVSNGMLFNTDRAKKLLDEVDLIAVSIDGKPDLHNEIRGLNTSFEKMLEGVDILKSMSKLFGFIHTVTRRSWDSMLWLGEFAKSHNAKLLQFHPLEMYGRAKKEMVDFELDQEILHKVFIISAYLKSKYEGDIFVQLDLLHRDYIEEYPQTVNVFEREFGWDNIKLSDLLNTIIINEDGDIVPIVYGFSKNYVIGNISDIPVKKNLFEKYINNKWESLSHLFMKVYKGIISNKEIDLINWNELIVKESEKSPVKSNRNFSEEYL